MLGEAWLVARHGEEEAHGGLEAEARCHDMVSWSQCRSSYGGMATLAWWGGGWRGGWLQPWWEGRDEGDLAGRPWWRAALVLRGRRREGDGSGRWEVEKGATVAGAL